ncbi:ABC transporter C family member 3 [Spatholobus suberectus]|nr:ABC transporter C family member 3 [Spatholobus suberectus]
MRVAVCGTVGSGKSSLLSCIIGEIPKISRTLKVCGSKAYVSQSPWIQSGTIEDNILFGKEMDKEKYEKVLEACSLTKDLEVLPFGDQTIIGEKGINLSGGQKQRVQIAPSLYQDAGIYLFDDPFSVVDAHTGSHLFRLLRMEKIGVWVKGNWSTLAVFYLRKARYRCLMKLQPQLIQPQIILFSTVITISHRITSILDSDMVLFLNQGLIEEYDSPKKLLKNKSSSLAQLVAEYTRRSNSGFGS